MPYKNTADKTAAQQRWRAKKKLLEGDTIDNIKKSVKRDKPLKIENEDVETGLTLLKETFKDQDTGEPDQIIKTIEKLVQYAPLAMKAIQGFADRYQDAQQQKQHSQAQAQQTVSIQPPEGWESKSELDRYSRKYDGLGNVSEWYQQGEAYEQAKISGQVQIHGTPQQQFYPSGTSQAPQTAPLEQQAPQPTTIKELEAQYAQYEPQDLNSPEEFKDFKNPRKDFSKEKEKMQPEPEPIEELQKDLVKDNAMYIGLAVEFLNTMKQKEFEEGIENIDTIFDQNKAKFKYIPTSVRLMLKEAETKAFIDMFEKNCPEKYAYVKKQKKLPKLKKLFEKMKEEL